MERAPAKLNGVYAYDTIVDAVYGFAFRLTTLIQGGPMGPQISVILLAAVVAMGAALFQINSADFDLVDFYALPMLLELLIFAVAVVAAFATVRARSRLSAIISLGVVGVAVTLFFVFYSAPDLALTQLLIEVLTVILLVLVFFRIKPDKPVHEAQRRRVLRWVVAVTLGMFGAGVVLIDHLYQVAPSISPYFLANSLSIGQGGNVVNVILVDIRGYDTMGEITVLGLAALGGYAVLRSPQLHALRRRLLRARKVGAIAVMPPTAATPAEKQTVGAGDD
jgi:multicomponent Na+:H+ antiporter subunit A